VGCKQRHNTSFIPSSKQCSMKLINSPPQFLLPPYIDNVFVMSSSALIAVCSSSTWFAPQKPKIVSIGKTSVLLYPKVETSMSDPEKAMAFQKNKTALALANVDQKAHILALADCLDLMLTAKLSLANWELKLHLNWANSANLSILSWHGTNSAIINNTATAADTSILLPAQNGPAKHWA
jgi:hypothetical protein